MEVKLFLIEEIETKYNALTEKKNNLLQKIGACQAEIERADDVLTCSTSPSETGAAANRKQVLLGQVKAYQAEIAAIEPQIPVAQMENIRGNKLKEKRVQVQAEIEKLKSELSLKICDWAVLVDTIQACYERLAGVIVQKDIIVNEFEYSFELLKLVAEKFTPSPAAVATERINFNGGGLSINFSVFDAERFVQVAKEIKDIFRTWNGAVKEMNAILPDIKRLNNALDTLQRELAIENRLLPVLARFPENLTSATLTGMENFNFLASGLKLELN